MTLRSYRTSIDTIDREILALIARRMELSRLIGMTKRLDKKPVFDRVREVIVLKKAIQTAGTLDLSVPFVSKLIKQIMRESRRLQKESV
jgi:chorismate mutase